MRYLHIGHDALIVLDGALPLESLHLLVANLQTGKLNQMSIQNFKRL